MPAQEGGKINIIETTRLALKIFKEKHINFKFEDKIIEVNIDRTQMVRIITNLIKNALEACDLLENPIIQVNIKKKNKNVLIYSLIFKISSSKILSIGPTIFFIIVNIVYLVWIPEFHKYQIILKFYLLNPSQRSCRGHLVI